MDACTERFLLLEVLNNCKSLDGSVERIGHIWIGIDAIVNAETSMPHFLLWKCGLIQYSNSTDSMFRFMDVLMMWSFFDAVFLDAVFDIVLCQRHAALNTLRCASMRFNIAFSVVGKDPIFVGHKKASTV